MDSLTPAASYWLQQPLFSLTLTLLAFRLGLALYEYSGRNPILHPLVLAPPSLAALLKYLNIDYSAYLASTNLLYFLLGPATVALAVPLYQQLHHIRAIWRPIMLMVIFGGSFAALSAVAIAWILGGNEVTLLSLAPKSVTTPVALSLASEIGGLATLAAGAVVLTGLAGITVGPWLFKRLGIHDERVQGFTIGLVSHGVGTTRAFEISPLAGAFSSLALGLMALFTSLALPFAANWYLAN